MSTAAKINNNIQCFAGFTATDTFDHPGDESVLAPAQKLS